MERVIIQGDKGSYSHQFTLKYFGECDIDFVSTFEKVAQSVADGEYKYGVLPLENSTAGSIDDTYKLLVQYDLHIAGLDYIKINHCLLGVMGATRSSIREVSSHPQALMQCAEYIAEHNYTAVSAFNTAIASRELAKSADLTKGVVASKICADIYGLQVLEECIQDAELNMTRFVVITKELIDVADSNVVSVVCRTVDKRKSLSKLLAYFGRYNVNLTKIQSKNIANTNFEVNFYIDFEGNIHDMKIQKLLRRLQQKCREFRLLGVYKK